MSPRNIIDEDMRAVIAAQRLCFAATVTPDGRPNLSPKGTIRVWDDEHLLFCDIASHSAERAYKRKEGLKAGRVVGAFNQSLPSRA